MSNSPILYSSNGCPFCQRARIALKYASLKIVLRNVEVNNLPEEALAVSSHATVPSLVISDSEYFDESWDIVKWALQQNDPEGWLGENNEYLNETEMLVETIDHSFKEDLYNYKNKDNHTDHPMEYYRERGEEFLEELNEMLEENAFLLAPKISVADVITLPFVHQFSMVDKKWFDKTPYPKLHSWLKAMVEMDLFQEIMKKHGIWTQSSQEIYL